MSLITTTGNTDITVTPGAQYLLRLTGIETGDTVELQFADASDDFLTVDNGTFDSDGPTEARIIAPANTLRLAATISNGSEISAQVIPILA